MYYRACIKLTPRDVRKSGMKDEDMKDLDWTARSTSEPKMVNAALEFPEVDI